MIITRKITFTKIKKTIYPDISYKELLEKVYENTLHCHSEKPGICNSSLLYFFK